MPREKVKVGFYSLTGCAGDLLNVLNMEDRLLQLFNTVELMSFLMASSSERQGRVDIAFVEGSVSTVRDLEALKRIRENSSKLVALGNCAVWGGVQASLQLSDAKKLMKSVYATEENVFGFLGEHKALSDVVSVDYELPGCPIEQEEFLRLLIDLLRDVAPDLKDSPVCVDCKIREIPCLIIEKGESCLGPVTLGGCRARCPYHGSPCIGCRGPVKDEANIAGEVSMLLQKGWREQDIINRLKLFAARYRDLSKIMVERR